MLLFLICGWLSELRNPLPGRERWGNGGGMEGSWLWGWLVVVGCCGSACGWCFEIHIIY